VLAGWPVGLNLITSFSGVELPMRKLRCLVPRFVGVWVVLAFGCHGKSASTQHLPQEPARIVAAPQPVTSPQAASLESVLTAEFADAVRPSFEAAFAAVQSKDAKAQAAWAAQGFAVGAVKNLATESSSECLFATEREFAFASCVWENARSSSTNSGQWLETLVQNGAASSGNVGQSASFNSKVYTQVQVWILESGEIPKILSQLEKLAKNQSRIIELLLRRSVVADAPFLAESFFKDRKFVFTISLAQASFGRERMYNLANHMVKLQISSGKLVIIRDGSDLAGSSNYVDIIETSYPILQTIKSNNETYFQIDFSSPQNKEFLVQSLVGAVPQLSLSADVVVPKVSFVPKAANKTLGSSLYLNKSDSQMVIDNLVLVNGTDTVLSPDGLESAFDKDTVRPTVRVFQGLFAWNESYEQFAKTQAVTLSDAFGAVRQNGVDDRLSGSPAQDYPFFEAGGRLLDDGGRDRPLVKMARKFDTSQPIVWVLSANTPLKAEPVLKAAVLAFQPLFEKMSKAGSAQSKLVAYTQKEFLASPEASALGFASTDVLSAADPRVNMILWDESKSLGAAWATAVAAPTTGQVISADVMLSGTMWAKEGCLGYLKSQWSLEKESNTSRRKKGHVPSGGSRMMWEISCETALFTLGFYSPSEPSLMLTEDLVSQVTALTRSGDNVGLEEMLKSLKPSPLQTAAQIESKDLKSKILESLPVTFAKSGYFLNLADVIKASTRNPLNSQIVTTAEGKMTLSLSEFESSQSEKLRQKDGSLFSAKNGTASVNAALDCYLPVGIGFETQMSGIGSPIMESNLVKTPQEGALALLRSTLIHELGHAFGLRHNFAGSLQSAKLAPEAAPAVVPYAKTDSMMDYNDYSNDLEIGAMTDYSSPEGGQSLPNLGAYDLVALGALYKLDTSALKFTVGPQFCSDRNVGLVNDCQRYDWGTNYVEFLMHDANMQLYKIANVQSSDLILFDVNTLIGRPLGRLLEDLNKLTTVFATAQSSVKSTSQLEQKQFFFNLAEFAFKAQKAEAAFSQTQSYLKSFEKRMGNPLRGIYDFASLPKNIFDEPVFADILGDIIHEKVALDIMGAGNALKSAALEGGSDLGYFGVYDDVKMGTTTAPYLSDLMKLYAGQVVKAPGEALQFGYFLNGSVKEGSLATINGKPVVMTLSQPFFNHTLSKQVVPEIEIDNPDIKIGGTLKVPAVARGELSLSQMAVNLGVTSTLSGGYDQSPSFSRLFKDVSFLKKQLADYQACLIDAEKSKSIVPCVQLSAELLPMASVAVKFYDEGLGIAGNP
jgi:hypothetical protein